MSSLKLLGEKIKEALTTLQAIIITEDNVEEVVNKSVKIRDLAARTQLYKNEEQYYTNLINEVDDIINDKEDGKILIMNIDNKLSSKVMADKHAAYIDIETTDWADPELRKELDEDIFTGMSNEAMEHSLKEMNKINTAEVSNDQLFFDEIEDDLYSRSCAECGGDMNTGGVICTHCLTIEAQNDKLHDELREEYQKAEKEAIRRFLNDEEPSWSHSCLHEACPVTAGYGKLDDYGHWEYPLPEPIDQWSKKKDFDLKVKLNGMKYKARILPFQSDEIIKLNFLHCLYPDPTDECLPPKKEDHQQLSEMVQALSFRPTQCAGEPANTYEQRFYIEVVDETYQAQGSISINL